MNKVTFSALLSALSFGMFYWCCSNPNMKGFATAILVIAILNLLFFLGNLADHVVEEIKKTD